MVSLEINRTRFPFFTIQCAAGNTRNLSVTDYRFAIRHNGQHPTNQGDIITLPFIWPFNGHFTRRQKAI